MKEKTINFNDWLIANEESDEVQQILKVYGVSVEDIIGKPKKEVPKKYDTEKNTQTRKVIDGKGQGHPSGINIQDL